MKQKRQVKSVILETIKKQKMLSAGILTAVIGAVVAALISPLILAKIIDTVTAGNEAAFSVILLYFVLLALTGILEAASIPANLTSSWSILSSEETTMYLRSMRRCLHSTKA